MRCVRWAHQRGTRRARGSSHGRDPKKESLDLTKRPLMTSYGSALTTNFPYSHSSWLSTRPSNERRIVSLLRSQLHRHRASDMCGSCGRCCYNASIAESWLPRAKPKSKKKQQQQQQQQKVIGFYVFINIIEKKKTSTD